MAVLTTDEVLEKIGQSGPYQWRILAMLGCVCFVTAYPTFIMVFVAYEPPWMCTANSTACLLPNATGKELFSTSTQPIELYDRRCKLNRTDWKFADPDLYDGPVTSVVTEYDLVCGRSFQAWLSYAILFFGGTVGPFFIGMVSDKYGRRSVVFAGVLIVITLTFLMPFMPQMWLILLLRFIIGASNSQTVLCAFILATELVGPAKRAMYGTLIWFFFTFALVVLTGKAYFVRDWKTLCFITTAPYIFIAIFWRFVPESIRWLLVAGRKPEARKILEDIARVNKSEMPNEDLQVPVVEHNKGILELFSSAKLACITLIVCYKGFADCIIYYGVSFSAGDFGGNMYLNFMLTILVEFPGNYLAIDNSDRFGRKKTLISHTIIGTIACIAVAFIPAGTNNIAFIAGRVTGGMIGKLFVTSAFCTIFVVSAEVFPTIVRNSAMGLFMLCVNMGGFCAPFVVQLTRVSSILPFALMSGLALLSALLCCFLPETRSKPTLEVMADREVAMHLKVLTTRKVGDGNISSTPPPVESVVGTGKSKVNLGFQESSLAGITTAM